MIKELDTVVLIKDETELGLKSGDVGAVVYVYESGQAYEVEFVTASGETIAVLTLTEREIRPMHEQEILHVRSLEPA